MNIEDHNKSIVSDSQKDSHPVAGRKPAYESRATEFRQRLIVWKLTPESIRPSLRALATELGTTHQMLGYYLKGVEEWRAEEESKRIRVRAEAEGREMTHREWYDATVKPGLLRQIEKLRQAAKRGPLSSGQFKMLKLLATQFSGARDLLRKCRQMTPEEARKARAAERKAMFASAVINHLKRIKEAAEQGPLPWRDIEILKAFARRKCAEAKELLQKHSKNALPRPQVPR